MGSKKKKSVGNQDVKVLGKCYNSETSGKARYVRQVEAGECGDKRLHLRGTHSAEVNSTPSSPRVPE